jgi:hypothetical protein
LTPFPFLLPRVTVTSTSIAFPPPQLSCDRLAPERAPVQPPTPASHVLAPPLCTVLLLRMHVKTLCNIRSSTNPSGEMAAEVASIQDPQVAWVRSTMTEAKIQALVNRELLRPKEEVEWRAEAGSSSRAKMSRSRSSSHPSSSAASTSRWEISSAACCITTSWSW